ncbi:hypothetical protein [Falsiruegeria mediterranea]
MLNPKKVQHLTDQYEKYLDEITDRLWVVIKTTQESLKENTINEYQQIDFELCVLQLRKALEVTGFLCLLAHRPHYGKYSKRVTKMYEPGKVLKLVKGKNSTYFPVAIETNKKGKKQIDSSPVSETKMGPVLTEHEYLEAYNKFCGGNMHADHSYTREGKDTSKKMLEANLLAKKMMSLLAVHHIIVDQKYLIYAAVNGPDNRPTATFFSRVRE